MDAYDIVGNNGGVATTTASPAVALNGYTAKVYRIVVNDYCRILFGNSSVLADDTSPMYAPGETALYRSNDSNAAVYYSVMAVSGSVAWSINPSAVVQVPPPRIA